MPDAQTPHRPDDIPSADDPLLEVLLENALKEPEPNEIVPDEVVPGDDTMQESDSAEESHGVCADCGAPLEPYEDPICLACEDARYREHGVDDWM